MNEWISEALDSAHPGAAVIPAAFLLGAIASVTSCCNLPIIGAIAGYSGSLGQARKRRDLLLGGMFFMIGTILALAALGAVSGFIGRSAGSTLGIWWQLIAGLILVFFGLTSLDLLPFKLPVPRLVGRTADRGRLAAMVYGLALGGGATACTVSCSPVLPVVLAYSALQGGTVWGAVVLAVFAVGYSVPLAVGMIGLGLGVSRLQTAAQRLGPAIRLVTGALLTIVGFYLLATV